MLNIWSNYIFFSFSCLLKTTVCRLSNAILKDREMHQKSTQNSKYDTAAANLELLRTKLAILEFTTVYDIKINQTEEV